MTGFEKFIDNDFTLACKQGNIEKVKLLLNSDNFLTDYSELINKNEYNDITFINTCFLGHLEIVKLLICSDKLSNDFYIETNMKNINAFTYACI